MSRRAGFWAVFSQVRTVWGRLPGTTWVAAKTKTVAEVAVGHTREQAPMHHLRSSPLWKPRICLKNRKIHKRESR
jgi:hypothetical protein